jgi:DNA excision repair protein ERCC-3
VEELLHEAGATGLLVCRFTSQNKEMFAGDSGVMITTYNMISHTGRRSEEAQKASAMSALHRWLVR